MIKSPGEEGVGRILIFVGAGCAEAVPTAGGEEGRSAEVQAAKMNSPITRSRDTFLAESIEYHPLLIRWMTPAVSTDLSCDARLIFVSRRTRALPAAAMQLTRKPEMRVVTQVLEWVLWYLPEGVPVGAYLSGPAEV